jgi:hypothetical protein
VEETTKRREEVRETSLVVFHFELYSGYIEKISDSCDASMSCRCRV